MSEKRFKDQPYNVNEIASCIAIQRLKRKAYEDAKRKGLHQQYSRFRLAWLEGQEDQRIRKSKMEYVKEFENEVDLVAYVHGVAGASPQETRGIALAIRNRIKRQQEEARWAPNPVTIPWQKSEPPMDLNNAKIDPQFEIGCTRRHWRSREREILVHLFRRGTRDLAEVKKSLKGKSLADVVDYYYKNALSLPSCSQPLEDVASDSTEI